MKNCQIIPLFAITLFLHLSASAAVPLRWTVETSRATPAQFEAYQGETLALEASLQSYGKPLELSGIAALYWQTNGMGSTYWEAPAGPVPASSLAGASNVLFATWSPSMDVGAKVYNCFIGSPSNNYHAAFQLRLRPSPGATPNVLPLPVPVIDFAKVRVLNPPWESGGGGGVNTNAVRDIVREQLATNGIRSVDGAARPLPRYLHALDFADSYTNEAAAYYRSRGNGKTDGGCSSVRDGGFLYRNFDFPFDDRAEFVVKMSAGKGRFASVGVAQVGTNLTEQMVTSGKWSKWYKALPGATVDGINECGVACNINVVDGDPQTSGWHTTGNLDPLAAVRWILDNATNAQHAAEYIAANIRFPQGWTQNFHYMIADETSTYIVENGHSAMTERYDRPFMTNYRVLAGSGNRYAPWTHDGPGFERSEIIETGNITNAWYTNAYRRETTPQWMSDLADVLAYTNDIYNAWASHPKEYFRNRTNGGKPWWQTVHTSVYDISNRVLRVSVQETDDWYTFAVPASGNGKPVDAYSRAETDAKLDGKIGTSGTCRVSDDWEIYGVIHPSENPLVDWWFDGGAVFASEADHSIHSDMSDSALNSDHADSASSADFAATAEHSNTAENLNIGGGLSIEEIIDDTYQVWKVVDGRHPNGFILKPADDYISADNPTFSNEVAAVARTVTPTPSPTLRLYDSVRHCWWVLEIVNGIPTLTVED